MVQRGLSEGAIVNPDSYDIERNVIPISAYSLDILKWKLNPKAQQEKVEEYLDALDADPDTVKDLTEVYKEVVKVTWPQDALTVFQRELEYRQQGGGTVHWERQGHQMFAHDVEKLIAVYSYEHPARDKDSKGPDDRHDSESDVDAEEALSSLGQILLVCNSAKAKYMILNSYWDDEMQEPGEGQVRTNNYIYPRDLAHSLVFLYFRSRQRRCQSVKPAAVATGITLYTASLEMSTHALRCKLLIGRSLCNF